MRQNSYSIRSRFFCTCRREPASGGPAFISQLTVRDRFPGRHGLGTAALFLLLLLKPLALMGQPFAYVTNRFSETVSVINTTTNTVVATISVGSTPWGIAMTPDGNFAYVVNMSDNTVSVINDSTKAVVATVNVGANPRAVAMTPDGNFAYVTSDDDDTVSVINTSTNTVVATVNVATFPMDVAITPDGNFAYVTSLDDDVVSVINTSINTVVATVSVVPGQNCCASPYGIAITPDGNFAYVVNNDLDNISVINTSTNTVVAIVNVGRFPVGVAITPDGNFAYVTNSSSLSNSVSVINTSTNTVVETINVGAGSGPRYLAITPDGNFAYVTNRASDNVSVINTSTNTVVATINVGDGPGAIAIVPPSKFIIDLIDPMDGTLTAQLIDNNQITPDIDLIISADESLQRDGAATDGVSKLILRINANVGNMLDFTLVDDGQDNGFLFPLSAEQFDSGATSLTVTAESTTDGGKAFAIYQAPSVFGNPGTGSSTRNVALDIENLTTGQDTTVNIVLRRPPVILLHGLWSSAATWNEFKSGLSSVYWVFTPTYPSSASFFSNRNVVYNRVSSALQIYKQQYNLAAVKADVVAHSMGGMLARWYLSEDLAHFPYRRPNNYNDGDINKLITVGTPHSGSRWGNILIDNQHFPLPSFDLGLLSVTTLRELLEKYDHPIDGGALYDLAVPTTGFSPNGTSIVNGQIEASRSHAIYTDFNINNPNTAFAPTGYWGTIIDILLFVTPLTLDEIIDGDGVVAVLSQKGGLAFPQSTFVDGPFHIRQTTNSDIVTIVQALLEKSPDAPEFAAGFAPSVLSSSPLQIAEATLDDRPLSIQATELDAFVEIVAPESGISVLPGETISILAQGSEGQTISKVLFLTPDSSFFDESSPFEFALTIPDDALGSYPIAALGKDLGGGNSIDEIEVSVQTTATLDSISVGPETVLLQFMGEEVPLSVQGHYSDGVDRDLSGSSNGTVYLSANPAVVTVSSEGIVTALADGQAEVSAENGGVTESLEVVVQIDPTFTPPELPIIRAGIEALNFGEVNTNDSATLPATIFNDGSVSLEIQSATPGTSVFTITETLPLTIAPGDSQDLNVVFDPTEAGLVVSGITIRSSDLANDPFFVTLSGTGVSNEFDISGKATYCATGSSVQNTTLSLSGDASDMVVTDSNGDYLFANRLVNQNYVVTPSKVGDQADSGIGCFDAALAAQMAVGILTADHCDSTAADVDEDGNILTFDAALVCRFAVGLPAFSPSDKTGEWRFEPASRSYAPLEAAQIAQDFTAILLGDVDGSWTPAQGGGTVLAKGSSGRIQFVAQPEWSADGKAMTTGFFFDGGVSALAFELELSYDANALQYKETVGAPDGWEIFVNSNEAGRLRLGMFSTKPLAEASEFVRVKWEVLKEGVATELLLERALVNDELQARSALTTQLQKPIPTEFTLHQNYPNPFNPESNIDYELPEPVEVRLTDL